MKWRQKVTEKERCIKKIWFIVLSLKIFVLFCFSNDRTHIWLNGVVFPLCWPMLTYRFDRHFEPVSHKKSCVISDKFWFFECWRILFNWMQFFQCTFEFFWKHKYICINYAIADDNNYSFYCIRDHVIAWRNCRFGSQKEDIERDQHARTSRKFSY